MTETAIRTYADITPLEQEWLWKGYIPAAGYTLLAGAAGIGKGYLVSDLIARVTTGDTMPDGSESDVPAGSVVMHSYEDDPALDNWKRLDGAGADLKRIVRGGDDFSIPSGIAKLRNYCDRIGNVRLVTIDPLGSATELRGLTSCGPVALRNMIGKPLESFSRETGITVLLVHHLNKDGRTISGGQAIVDLPRSVLKIARNPANESVRMLTREKGNRCGEPADIGYKIGGDPVACRWLTLDGDESDPNGPDIRRGVSVAQRVADVLASADGPLDVQTIMARASADYQGTRTALTRSGIAAKVPGMRGYWQLDQAQLANVAPIVRVKANTTE